MLPSQGSAQDIENARAALLLIAVGVAIFWREVLRVLLALVAMAVCIGAFMLLQNVRP
jgi:hypothetical protein